VEVGGDLCGMDVARGVQLGCEGFEWIRGCVGAGGGILTHVGAWRCEFAGFVSDACLGTGGLSAQSTPQSQVRVHAYAHDGFHFCRGR